MTITKQEFFACYQKQFDFNQEFGYPILTLAQFAYDMLQEACQNSDYDSDDYLDHCMAMWEYYESNIAG
jgi:hypothetical protein